MSVTTPSFAVAVAVGPGPREVERLRDLADSIAFYEPSSAGTLVLVDDHATPRNLDRELALPPTLRAVSLHHPRHGATVKYRVGKGICSAIMLALGFAQRETDAEVVLKVDTDSLVIASFRERLSAAFAANASLAILGAYTRTPTGESRDWSHHVPRVEAAARPPFSWRRPIESMAARRAPSARMIATLLAAARRHGYDTAEHCMGGGYAVSRTFLDRAAAAGHFDRPERWTGVDLPEDVVVALHARSLGMRLGNHVAPGETFGVRYVGLPMPPARLVESGYAVIHAVKNDPALSEDAIRAFFRERRRA